MTQPRTPVSAAWLLAALVAPAFAACNLETADPVAPSDAAAGGGGSGSELLPRIPNDPDPDDPSECEPGAYGDDCAETCACDNGTCDDGRDGDGSCTCEPGWAGAACDECASGYFGEDCAGECPAGFAGESCDECATGWAGEACDECAPGWTGEACDACEPNRDGEDCDQCAIGWTGDDCDTCSLGWAGEACDTCAPHFSGEYCDGCAPGWTGDACNACAPGFTGQACDTCAPGWAGQACDECAPRWAGAACDTCATGWSGPNCDTLQPMSLGNSGCTYTQRILSNGMLVCATSQGAARYYTNGDGAEMEADLDLDGTADVTYRGGGTWTDFATGLTTNISTFADDPISGDVYLTRMHPTTFQWTVVRYAGGVTGEASELVSGEGSATVLGGWGIASDDKYLYAAKSSTLIGRWSLATQEEAAPLEISNVSFCYGMAVDDNYLYIGHDNSIRRVDKATGGAAEIIVGTGVAGPSIAPDGVTAAESPITMSSYSFMSASNGRVYFVDQSGYTQAPVRYVDAEGKLQSLPGVLSSINQGVFVRGNVAFVRTQSIVAPLALPVSIP